MHGTTHYWTVRPVMFLSIYDVKEKLNNLINTSIKFKNKNKVFSIEHDFSNTEILYLASSVNWFLKAEIAVETIVYCFKS